MQRDLQSEVTEQTEQPEKSDQGGRLMRELYFPTYIYYQDLPDAAALNDDIKPHIYA